MRHSLKGLGNIIVFHSLAQSRKDHDGDHKTERRGKTVHSPCKNSVLLLYVGDRHTQNRAVRGDERKVYTQRLIQRLHILFQEHFHKLHQRCDNQNKDDGL